MFQSDWSKENRSQTGIFPHMRQNKARWIYAPWNMRTRYFCKWGIGKSVNNPNKPTTHVKLTRTSKQIIRTANLLIANETEYQKPNNRLPSECWRQDLAQTSRSLDIEPHCQVSWLYDESGYNRATVSTPCESMINGMISFNPQDLYSSRRIWDRRRTVHHSAASVRLRCWRSYYQLQIWVRKLPPLNCQETRNLLRRPVHTDNSQWINVSGRSLHFKASASITRTTISYFGWDRSEDVKQKGSFIVRRAHQHDRNRWLSPEWLLWILKKKF